MGRGLSQLQRQLLEFTDERRRTHDLEPAAWCVVAEKPLDPKTAERATKFGRDLYNHFVRKIRPSAADLVACIDARPELYAGMLLGHEVHVLLALAREEAFALSHAIKQATQETGEWSETSQWSTGLADRPAGISIQLASPDVVTWHEANRDVERRREAAPGLQWFVGTPSVDRWHASVKEAMDALYGAERTSAESNRARAAVTRSVARLCERNLMVRSAPIKHKRMYESASFAITHDGISALSSSPA